MVAYLDALDALDQPVPPARRVSSPRSARGCSSWPRPEPQERIPTSSRSSTPPAPWILGSGPLLAPEVAVVLETDPEAARHLARRYASIYLGLPNYTTT